jgi:hypothetical protein
MSHPFDKKGDLNAFFGRVSGLLDRIESTLSRGEYFVIDADMIPRDFEFRLLFKKDTSKLLPDIFIEKGWSFIPLGNSKVGVAQCDGYIKFPLMPTLKSVSINMDLYNKEALKSVIYEPYPFTGEHDIIDFLNRKIGFLNSSNGEAGPIGRSRYSTSCNFISKKNKIPFEIDGIQIEPDGVFQYSDKVVVVEAKTNVLEDLTLRQIFPLWKSRYDKNLSRGLDFDVKFVVVMSAYDGYVIVEVEIPDPDVYAARVVNVQHVLLTGKVVSQNVSSIPIPKKTIKQLKVCDIPQANDILGVIDYTILVSEISDNLSLAKEMNIGPREVTYRRQAALSLGLVNEINGKIVRTLAGDRFKEILCPQNRLIYMYRYLNAIPFYKELMKNKRFGFEKAEKLIQKSAPLASSKIGKETLKRRLCGIWSWFNKVEDAYNADSRLLLLPVS